MSVEYELFGATTAAGVFKWTDGLVQATDTAIAVNYTSGASVSFNGPGVFRERRAAEDLAPYGRILRDPCVPVRHLQVIVNDAAPGSFFEGVLRAEAIPSSVVVIS